MVRLQNDLYCVEWGVKLYSNQLVWRTRYTDTFCNAVDCRFELTLEVQSRGVHGNGEDWDPMGPMRFPWEWE